MLLPDSIYCPSDILLLLWICPWQAPCYGRTAVFAALSVFSTSHRATACASGTQAASCTGVLLIAPGCYALELIMDNI